jgi:signal transduction histidine kinase
MELLFRERKRKKTEVMALCDVSSSVWTASRFMLNLLYAIQDQFSKVRSFVFVSDLGEVTEFFSRYETNEAIRKALKEAGIQYHSYTDYGDVLLRFREEHLGEVNSRTVVIIIGDGRNNRLPSRAWVLEEIKGVENLKDQFLTTLSHELKTPLVSLKGFLQLIIQQRVKPEEQAEYLQVCWRNLLKMERQINNLLELARLSNFKDQYPLTPLDLAALIRTEAENLRLAAQEKQVRIILDQVPPGPVMIKGHSEKIIQLLDNLLLNAIKYNVANGRVEVSLSQREAAVVLTVADSGKGIARENMAKIFNRFYRADVSGTGRLEGLGIGLSLVQEIVKLHQGDIEVESEPGKGTVFTVILEAAS